MPNGSVTQSLHVIAYRLAQQYNFSILPIHRTSKIPAIRWKALQERLPTDDEIAAWFANAEVNVGIVTGAVSGIVVVDADSDAAIAWAMAFLPTTPMQTLSGGGGRHFFFRHPGVPVRNRTGIHPVNHATPLKLDVRADGGYVVAPGSIHSTTGQPYRAPVPWPATIDALPIFDVNWLAEPPRPAPPPRVVPVSDVPVLDRARKYLDKLPRPEIGGGSDAATYMAACRLVRGFALPASDAEALLWDWAGQRPGWTFDWIAEKVRCAERFGTEQIGRLR